MTRSTPSSRAITARDFPESRYGSVEVREMTLMPLALERSAISASCMPSAKYWPESPEDRLSSGKTASDGRDAF